jgi:hypothetical protein
LAISFWRRSGCIASGCSPGLFEYYWKPPEPIHVRLKAPPRIGAVQTLSGRHITIGEDRIVEMSAEDANCLIPDGWIKLAEWSADPKRLD